MGPGRSLRKLIEQRVHNGSKASTRLATLAQWSSWYHWQDYVKDYDAAQLAEKQRKAAEAIDRLNEAQAKMAQDASMRVFKRLTDLLQIDEAQVKRWKESLVEGGEKLKEEEELHGLLVSPRTMVDYFRTTVELARTAMGAATQVVQQQIEVQGLEQGPRQTLTIDLSELTLEQLRVLRAVLDQPPQEVNSRSSLAHSG